MAIPLPRQLSGDAKLIKQNLAEALQKEIFEGRLLPGQRIVEGPLAKKFGVAQASVREAINLLVQNGFAEKRSGRSARVTQYSKQDVARLYEVRGVLEGLAARLTVERKADLAPLANTLQELASAIQSREMPRVLEVDMRFHLTLCELSGNPILYEHLRRILAPLFGFALIRATQSRQTAEAWLRDFGDHERLLDLLREGDPGLAEQYVRHLMNKLASHAYAIWENKEFPNRDRDRAVMNG
jgi:DNA-binding GntR family transcriptional regulator